MSDLRVKGFASRGSDDTNEPRERTLLRGMNGHRGAGDLAQVSEILESILSNMADAVIVSAAATNGLAACAPGNRNASRSDAATVTSSRRFPHRSL